MGIKPAPPPVPPPRPPRERKIHCSCCFKKFSHYGTESQFRKWLDKENWTCLEDTYWCYHCIKGDF
jgi:hypothetical protein